MKKLLLFTVLAPVYAFSSYKVASCITVENKTTERSHQVAEGDHIVYPCEGMILDAVVTPVTDKQGNQSEYKVHLKMVHRTGATLAEQDRTAKWGQEVSFICPTEKVTAELTMKVTEVAEVITGVASQLETAAA